MGCWGLNLQSMRGSPDVTGWGGDFGDGTSTEATTGKGGSKAGPPLMGLVSVSEEERHQPCPAPPPPALLWVQRTPRKRTPESREGSHQTAATTAPWAP